MSGQDDQNESEIITRINVLTSVARTNWFGLLAYLSFVGVTLLGVKDIDFFMPERETMLPLVGVSVPTSLFFYIAPVLGAMLYIHLHLYLLKLWRALAELPAIDTSHEERISPWIVSDMAFAVRSGVSHAYPLRKLAFTATFISIFLAGPVVLGAFWWRSMPKHDEWLTIVFCGLPLFLCVLTGVESWRTIRLSKAVSMGTSYKEIVGWSVGLLLLTGVGALTTEGIITDRFLRPAQLQYAVFVETPEGWLPRSEAEQVFRRQWCEREGINWLACGFGPLARDDEGMQLPDPDYLAYQRMLWCKKTFGEAIDSCQDHFKRIGNDYISDWRQARNAELDSLQRRDLSERDLRKADLTGAKLYGANLHRAQLSGARLWLVAMENVDLRWANLEEAQFSSARMEGSYLRFANLKKAFIGGSWMEGADLFEAFMEESELKGVNMHGVDLRGTSMNNAKLSRVLLDSETEFGMTMFSDTDFNGTKLTDVDLSQADIKQEYANVSFGDASVILPESINRPAHWPDWELPDEGEFSGLNQWEKWKDDPSTYTPPSSQSELD